MQAAATREHVVLGGVANAVSICACIGVCGGTCTSTLFRRLVRHNTLQDGRIHYSRALFGSDGESLQHEFSDEQ